MPLNDVVALRQNLLARIKAGDALSDRDVKALIGEIKKDGVTTEEVQATVAALVEAMTTGWDPRAGSQEKRVDKLLGALHAARPDALDVSRFTSAGRVNWLDFVLARAGGGTPVTPNEPPPPPPAGDARELAKKGFGGETLALTSSGGLVANGAALPTNFAGAPVALRAALVSLARPGALDGVDDVVQQKLAAGLCGSIAAVLPLAGDNPQKFEGSVAVFGALGALSQMADKLASSDVDALLAAFSKLPSPAQQAVALRILDAAPKTEAQKAAVAALPAVGDKEVLLKAFDDARSEQLSLGSGDKLSGEAAAVTLTALAFAKNAGAVDSIKKGLEEYAKINAPSSWSSGGLDAEEARAVAAFLLPYVNNASSTQLVFGAFLQDAPKEVAKHTNARVVAQLAPQLEGAQPKIGGVPLSAEQAAVVKQLLPGIKDEAASAQLAKALTAANAALSTSITTWGTPPPPSRPLDPAAFAVFERIALTALDGAKDTKDGMIDMAALARDVESDAKALGETVVPHLRTLAQTPPKMGTVIVSPELADTLKSLLLSRARSPLSAPNLLGALEIVAEKSGGRVEGAAADKFKQILDGYMAEFPNAKLFDFNKLGRIASFQIEGKQVPLCTLNGQPVKLAEFYGQVGQTVSKAIDKSLCKHEWFADRWGWRAKESVELLDVIAQKMAEDAGPLHVLKKQFPNAKIDVLATGRNGEHQRFMFKVEGQGVFVEQSDGLVTKYNAALTGIEPVLFTAAIRDDGSFDVQVPNQIRTPKYPLQTPFSLGDSVDVLHYDAQAQERAEEGKPFETRYKVLHGTIKAYDAQGYYTIAYTDPQGKEQEKRVHIDEMKKSNMPHLFPENASYFSDVNININTDAKLKEFLDGAQPIINKYLPTDGSTLSLSQGELVKRQKQCIAELMKYTHARVKYPADKNAAPDELSRRYHEIVGDGFARVPLGQLVDVQRGVCRHQCILEHLLLQRAGIDSRLASGAANTYGGDFRGFHIWVELSLADNARYLSDQTWDDATIPLWEGAYAVDKRRVEMYDRTSRYDYTLQD